MSLSASVFVPPVPRFAFTVRRSPSFVPPVSRSRLPVSRSRLPVSRSRFSVRGCRCLIRRSRLPGRSPLRVRGCRFLVRRSRFAAAGFSFAIRRSRTYNNLSPTHGKNCMPTSLAAAQEENTYTCMLYKGTPLDFMVQSIFV